MAVEGYTPNVVAETNRPAFALSLASLFGNGFSFGFGSGVYKSGDRIGGYDGNPDGYIPPFLNPDGVGTSSGVSPVVLIAGAAVLFLVLKG